MANLFIGRHGSPLLLEDGLIVALVDSKDDFERGALDLYDAMQAYDASSGIVLVPREVAFTLGPLDPAWISRGISIEPSEHCNLEVVGNDLLAEYRYGVVQMEASLKKMDEFAHAQAKAREHLKPARAGVDGLHELEKLGNA